MNINIVRLTTEVQIPFKSHEDDFCYDCIAISEEEVAPNVWKYGLGIAVQPASKYDGSSIRGFNIRARSSVWKTGMVLSNCQGTVDEGYTGEMSAVFYHVMPNMPRYRVGDKVCQLCLERTEPLNFIEVSELRDTNRGANGYGSTGNR